jgi:hypothetical protein
MVSSARAKTYFIFFLAIPLILFFYYLNLRTPVAYGDDLYVYRSYGNLDGVLDKMNLPVEYGKFRPVQGLGIELLIEWFHKNLFAFYLFNILIQSINTILFALILNRFLKSTALAFFCSLTLGFSRFCYFNIAQLLNGGVLEGLAMTFFLSCLYFIIKAGLKPDQSEQQKKRAVIWSIVLANLAMYTHERYLVLFPFIILIIFLVPSLRKIKLNNRLILTGIAILSIILNVAIKKTIMNLPFFVGTGGTNIEISFSTVLTFFYESLFSLFGINSGPQFLIGMSFTDLPLFHQILIILSVAIILLGVGLFIYTSIRKRKEQPNDQMYLFLGLGVLFFLFVGPAIITIRVEPRWLQASFAILILLTAIALKDLKFRNKPVSTYAISLVVVIFLWTDFTYLQTGTPNTYMANSVRIAEKFQKAVRAGVIKPGTRKLYIWEMKRDANSESAINWVLGDGYFFNFYGGAPKEVIFADTIFQRGYSFALSSFINFDKSRNQIIYIHDDILDITNEYLKDSLKRFTPERAIQMQKATQVKYGRKIQVTNNDFDKFLSEGFFDREGEIRWTNGNSSFEFLGSYVRKDTVNIDLTTYMPPICLEKKIVPAVSIVDEDKVEYQPLSSSREGDKFRFKFYLPKATSFHKIKMTAPSFVALPDTRNLSFPFISLEIN